ncbi:hypothetical protein AX17_002146 [Amanita inopinata Kibby_2008]|nr:hypothetical protein AX17_002146 [Amanita inopinata Kibby_2008]
MLASRSETPRPRPPAKARRSTSTKRVLRPSVSSPPPSYADSFGRNVGTGLPRSTTEEALVSPPRVGKERETDSGDFWGLHGDGEESRYHAEQLEREDDCVAGWGTEDDAKSPEMVSEMLDRADDIFRERENDELGSTVAACRTLYEENIALKNRHQKLATLAHQTESPLTAESPLPTMPPLFSTPSRYGYTYSHSTPERLSDLSSSSRSLRRGHAQRVSMSAVDVAYLADQNAELLEKLEKLEYDSSHADHSGRRQLKRLEKEIADLREELEKTQARSDELEEKTKHGWNSEQVINAVARKKLEREAKMMALRNLGHGGGSSEETEVMSFAPEGSKFGGPSSGFSFMTPGGRSQASSVNIPRHVGSSADTRAVSSPFPTQELTTSETMPIQPERPEIVLINQIMDKMVELQEANVRIIEQQTETSKQLQAFQKETEQMNKVYQSLNEPFQVEDASDSDHDGSEVTKFHSFSQIIEGHPLRNRSGNSETTRHRRRTLGSGDVKAAKSATRRLNASTSKLSLPVPFPLSPELNRHHSLASLHDAFLSPALSSLSLESGLDGQADPPFALPTLQSELGNAFDAENLDNNFHIRSSSVFNLTSQPSPSISLPPSPSPSPGHLLAYRVAVDEAENAHDIQGPPTPMSLGPRGNSLHLHPGGATNEMLFTPAMDKLDPLPDFIGLQSPRYYRMSQTVRSRTDRWVRGRFGTSLMGSAESPAKSPCPPPAPLGVSQRLAHAFETVVEGFTSSARDTAAVSDEEVMESAASSRCSSPSSTYEDATLANVSPASGMATKKAAVHERQGLGKVVLELWLWLQFVVIIFVFLWAMARKGPKAVLFEGNAADGKRSAVRR